MALLGMLSFGSNQLLDGTTNGPGPITFNPGVLSFTLSPFGTQCAMDIDTEEMVFEANGFTPWP